MALWSGRFTKELNNIANEYNSSIKIDHVMYQHDIEGSIAHATMLGKTKIISGEDSKKIVQGLQEILADIRSGKLEIDMSQEDIHMFIETVLTERIGDAGKKLHTARSRNDQVATDTRLYLRDRAKSIIDDNKALIRSIIELAEDNIMTIMPAYTHMQAAQPVTFAHYILAYAQMISRDVDRFETAKKRMNESPLGSCALATTTHDIDRFMTAEFLSFDKPTSNSIDAVSDRDFILDMLYAASVEMMHLSRLSEELIVFSTQEYRFIELDDSFSTGSSIMPQKKNPDMAELIRGKTGTVYGKLMGMLSTMKSLPLAYNKDMQEDKETVFESLDTLSNSIKVMIGMLDTLTVNKEIIRQKAAHGYIVATDLADYLVNKSVPFRDAYTIVGNIIRDASKESLDLEKISVERYRQYSNKFDEDLYDAISLEKCVQSRNVYSGPSEEAVLLQIKELKEKIDGK